MSAIHREVYGHGPVLVMLHGWAMHSGVWREFARDLAGSRQVICLDLPGHGLSAPIEPFNLDRLAEILIKAIPAEKFELLGWSLGASVALRMASLYPQRVESLSILAGNPLFVQTETWPGVSARVLDNFAEQLKSNPRQTLLRFLALQVNSLPDAKSLLPILKSAVMACDMPPERILRAGLEILKQSDLRAELKKLQCPVKLIQGDRDGLIPLALAEAVRQLKPEIGLHVLEQAGHVLFLSHRRQLLEILAA